MVCEKNTENFFNIWVFPRESITYVNVKDITTEKRLGITVLGKPW